MIFEEMVDSVLRRHSIVNREEQERGRAIIKRLRDLLGQTHQGQTTLSEEAGVDPGQDLRSGCEADLSGGRN